ncbi:hypothetical protein SAY87_030184 [Trapa incisa]|uniref:BAHD acyltransferase DCR n=1 Tax=Trapa incisa TaxID=236973 RepID=A0AAN7K7U8_9MYRT|nr:hypothetical protein SAY87_030184 [Trapa incisa]
MVQAKTVSKTHVKPKKRVGRKEYQLVTFDLPYLAFYYNQKLLFYKVDNINGGGHDFEGIVAKLKGGLEVALEEFHQLAGRLGKDDEGVFRVEYDDDDLTEGVEVVEASAEDISVDDLAAEEGTEILKDFIPYNGILNLEGLHRPLLSIQLTKLRDGVAIGCAFNHAVLDGTSTWHFMNSWAQICSGFPAGSSPPFLDRTKTRNARVKLDLTAMPDPSSQAEAEANGTEDHIKPGSQAACPKLRERVFKFSEVAIDKIKKSVNAGGGRGSTPTSQLDEDDGSSSDKSKKAFSTFQSLGIHIWRAVTAARGLKPEDITVFTVFVDCRKRVEPPMPETYFGNLIQAIFTGTAAGLLLAHPPEYGAGLIQGAIDAHDAAAINKRNSDWEAAPKIFQFKDAGANCVAVGSSPRFKVYDVDFGFGRPEGVRSGSNNRFDGMVYLYQGKTGGRSIDVEIALDPITMERLEMDKGFRLEMEGEKQQQEDTQMP